MHVQQINSKVNNKKHVQQINSKVNNKSINYNIKRHNKNIIKTNEKICIVFTLDGHSKRK